MLLISLNNISYLHYDNCNYNLLYKKAGYKLIGSFQEQIILELKPNWSLIFFAKCKGKNLKKSLYILPSLLSSYIIYGNCIVLQKIDNNIININETNWKNIIQYINNIDNNTSIILHKCVTIIPQIIKNKENIVRKNNNKNNIENIVNDDTNININANVENKFCNNNKTYLDCQIELVEEKYIEYNFYHN